jgi:phosphorylase kinase alpha/beta subunit
LIQVYNQTIQHQSLTTGLFPVFSNSKKEPHVGHVRDTIYCAIAVWSLRQCYSKVDDDKGRTYHLGQVAVKAMRGILFCWMRQAHKLEKYKVTALKENALHCKFNINTGDELNDELYGHLQLDCVALYLLTLAQMISSGLQVKFQLPSISNM